MSSLVCPNLTKYSYTLQTRKRYIPGVYETIEGLDTPIHLMTLIELFPALRNLSRTDKLKAMQFLVAELTKEEEASLEAGATYTIYSPLNSHEAAHKLAELLESDRSTPNA
ncbi:MAG: hypothetical protein LRZ84_13970 [Desertifilum sp.]|nr:hypothetical protein [Desertifilum sp.]